MLMRHIPSTLAGTGLVIVFMRWLAAHTLYSFIGPVVCITGMAIVAIGAILLGWLYGPVISAIGLLGGGAAPFLISGDTDNLTTLYFYFVLLGISGLTIDSLKRFVWVSYLALVIPAVGISWLWLTEPRPLIFAIAVLCLCISAIILPLWSLKPVYNVHPLTGIVQQQSAPALRVGLAGGLLTTLAAIAMVYTGNDTGTANLGLGLLLLAYVGAARILAKRLMPKIFRHAYHRIYNRADAEDITQEAFMRLWKISPNWQQQQAQVSSWLYRVTENLCVDRLRKKSIYVT
jgi:hypothetical protein